jgi:hypothetical protein
MTKLNEYVTDLKEKGLTEEDIGVFFLNLVAYADRRVLVSNLRTNQEKHVRQRQKEFVDYIRNHFSALAQRNPDTRESALETMTQDGFFNLNLSNLVYSLDGKVQSTYRPTIEGVLLKQMKGLKSEEDRAKYFSTLGKAVCDGAKIYAQKHKIQDKFFMEYRKLQDQFIPGQDFF